MDDFADRYKRHIMLPQVGREGQVRLSQSHVLVVGAGGLGSPVLLYLAAAGVGHLSIVDDDEVDISNLQRQVLHCTSDLHRPKVVSAREKINLINPNVEVTVHRTKFCSENASHLLDGCDVVVDCTDNAASKFVINDICVAAGIPLVHGAINEFAGNVMTIIQDSATLRDVFTPPPSDAPPASQYGVLGAVAGVVGSIQATEVLKVLLGIGRPLTDRMLTIDTLSMVFTTFDIRPKGK